MSRFKVTLSALYVFNTLLSGIHLQSRERDHQGPKKTCDYESEVQRTQRHEFVKRISVGEWSERSNVIVHHRVGNDVPHDTRDS